MKTMKRSLQSTPKHLSLAVHYKSCRDDSRSVALKVECAASDARSSSAKEGTGFSHMWNRRDGRLTRLVKPTNTASNELPAESHGFKGSMEEGKVKVSPESKKLNKHRQHTPSHQGPQRT